MFCALLGSLAGNAALTLGAGHSARAQPDCASNPDALIVYHAGSLNAAFTTVEKLFTEQTGICVRDVAAGSLDVGQLDHAAADLVPDPPLVDRHGPDRAAGLDELVEQLVE